MFMAVTYDCRKLSLTRIRNHCMGVMHIVAIATYVATVISYSRKLLIALAPDWYTEVGLLNI